VASPIRATSLACSCARLVRPRLSGAVCTASDLPRSPYSEKLLTHDRSLPHTYRVAPMVAVIACSIIEDTASGCDTYTA
jgi:hypothetical protein